MLDAFSLHALRFLPARPAAGWLAWSAAWWRDALEQERVRWLLWLPVAVGAGVAWYFALPGEPPAWLGAAVLLPAAFALAWWRRRGAAVEDALSLWLGLWPVLALGLGFAAAQWRTATVDAPSLAKRGAYMVEGRVALVEDRVRGQRLTLERPRIEGLAPAATPATIRFSRRDRQPAVAPGDWVRARAMLMPPSPPSQPGGFDFARQAYFARLGAVGYSLGALEWTAGEGGWDRHGLAALRQDIAGAVSAAVPGPAGAVGVALLTGLRGAIPDQVWLDMQIAGIAHLLAISGLHLGLVAGTLFFAARVALALCPPLALRLPGKKVAAAVALAGALGYLLLSGATIPTQRAFIMTALMLLAVMVDRNPFSMRLVAFAALAVLLLRPDSLLGASFQMSFAAVVALIAVYETGIAKRPGGTGGLDWRLLLYVLGVALTTVVASLATAPLSVFHFGRLPTFGLLANLLAVPLTAFWIMPLGLAGLLLLPLGFGLGSFCFALMGYGIEIVLALAALVASWPGAALQVAQPALAGLVLVTLGSLWLCLWQRPWRRLGVLGIAAGLAVGWWQPPPDLLVERGGRIVAVRNDGGRLALSPWQRDGWVTDGWLRSAGQAEAAPWPESGRGGAAGLRCDALGCLLERAGRRVALARMPEALEEDCARADLVISYPRVERCYGPAALIGPAALWDSGGLAIWIRPDRIETYSVREARGARPWVR